MNEVSDPTKKFFRPLTTRLYKLKCFSPELVSEVIEKTLEDGKK